MIIRCDKFRKEDKYALLSYNHGPMMPRDVSYLEVACGPLTQELNPLVMYNI